LWQLPIAAAVRLRPNDAFVVAAHADFLSEAFGPSAQAESGFTKAIELDPQHEVVRFWYGKHLLRAKRYSDARRELLLADRLGHRRASEVLAELSEDQND
jgi:Flp pilus assembly protein TadD